MLQTLDKIDYEFVDSEILRLALTHRSVGKNNNERLEFVGDSILGFIIAEELFTRFPSANEGDLSRLRAVLVQKSTLAEVARELDLGSGLILGSGELKSGGAKRDSILADALEAVIYAIYLDADLKVCRGKVLQWFGSRLTKLNIKSSIKDAKTRLQEYLQAKKANLPLYEVYEVTGKDHQQVFSIHCTVSLLPKLVLGQGGNRREAEQQAAENALERLGIST
jgi:ribonuclease III